MNGLTFHAIRDHGDGAALAPLFASRWSGYLRWYLGEGDRARPSYAECARQMQAHLPELVPAWQRLSERFTPAGSGGDLMARFLSLWNPPAFVSGCTQAIWTRERPALIRNYDYPPEMTDATLLHSSFTATRVMAMADCAWGVLDGINQHGLTVSLAFGGRRSKGQGFGIAIVLRYVLEICETARQALEVLRRVPVHLPYNLAILDDGGDWRTVFISPDRKPEVRREPYSANRQDSTAWPEDDRVADTVRREALLENVLGNPAETRERLLERFTERPIYRPVKPGDWGTLYTACYQPATRALELRWPNERWHQSIDAFSVGTRTAYYS
jgi:predicted choloylglycine hydrolase